jgi:hypothetical protein
MGGVKIVLKGESWMISRVKFVFKAENMGISNPQGSEST